MISEITAKADIRTCQPYYKTPLSTDDAIDIIRNAGVMFGVLSTHRSEVGNFGRSSEAEGG